MSTACVRCGKPAVVRRALPGTESTETQPVCERCAVEIDGGAHGGFAVNAAALGRAGAGIGLWGGLGCLVVGGAAWAIGYVVLDYINKHWH